MDRDIIAADPNTIGKVAARIENEKELEWTAPHKSTITDLERDLMLQSLKYTDDFIIETDVKWQDLHAVGPHRMVLWRHQVLAGLRLPPPPFLCKICEYFRMPITQLHPSAIRRAFTFHVIMSCNRYKDTAELFYQTQTARIIGKFYGFQSHPSAKIKFLDLPPSLPNTFQHEVGILTLHSGTIESEFGLSRHELDKERKYYQKDGKMTLPTIAKALIDALGSLYEDDTQKKDDIQKKDNIRKKVNLKKLGENEDLLIAMGLFVKETREVGKFLDLDLSLLGV